jgi:hypothetical protein
MMLNQKAPDGHGADAGRHERRALDFWLGGERHGLK